MSVYDGLRAGATLSWRRVGGLSSISRVLPGIWLTILVIAIGISPIIGRYDPDDPSTTILSPPSSAHLFGTDELGRDVFARVLAGGWASFEVAGAAILLGLLFGVLVGTTAASGRRILDSFLMRSMDILLAFPAIVLALLMSMLLGTSVLAVAVLIGIVMAPQIARMIRNRLSTELDLGYVIAERAAGASLSRTLGVHVSRNVFAPIGAFCLLLFADAMLFEAALSYVGVGIQPPQASWGNMILEGQKLILSDAWWVSIFPGTVLFITIACINTIGDRWLAEADPLLSQGRR